MHNLKNIWDWIRYSVSQFNDHEIYLGHGTNHPLDEAHTLVLGLLNLPFDLDPAYFQSHLTDLEQKKIQEALHKRIHDRVPVPYLTQRILYGDLEFYIDERALIPRSPIAQLLPDLVGDAHRILDLCCGSGCLGIVAKYHARDAQIVLADLDEQALQVAQINVDKNHLGDDVTIIQSDLFQNLNGVFDVIICNPPYVEDAEYDEVPPEYHHEPKQALYAGEDGMDLVRKILHSAPDYLSEDGLLILEVGANAHLLESAFPDCDFDWVDLPETGICIIQAEELHAWRLAGFL